MSKMSLIAVVLLLVAVTLRSEVIGIVAIALGAAVLLSRLWMRSLERGLRIRRVVPPIMAHGEDGSVRLTITNPTLLRVPWLELRDSVALGLRRAPPPHSVITLGAGAEHSLSYLIRGTRRGWYSVGPLQITLGDVLGFSRVRLEVPPLYVTVYPRVVPLGALGVPATLGFGPLQPLGVRQRSEDPARPAGVRRYVPGDDVRRLDWKSTARQNIPLVRRAEPTIAPDTTIVLAFARHDYPAPVLQDALDRAATVAASFGIALLERKLPVGLISNGYDPQRRSTGVSLVRAKGEGQRGLLLGTLGRLEPGRDLDLFAMLHGEHLSWGGTLVLVLADLTLAVLPHVLALRRRGQQVALVLVEGSTSGLALAQQQHLIAYKVDRRGLAVRERSL